MTPPPHRRASCGFVPSSSTHPQSPDSTTVVSLADSLAPFLAFPEVIASQPVPRGTELLLLVEDDPTVRHLLGILLRALGYTVLEAHDAATALDHIRNAPGIALLLTDVVLRGVDGVALAAQAQALQPRLRILFSSGYPRDILLRDAHMPAEAPLLTKPYQVIDLARQIRETLAQHPH